MDTQQRISLFLEMMSCCNDICYWCFDDQFQLVGTNGKLGESFFVPFFKRENGFAQMKLHGENGNMPLISSGFIGVEWACVYEKENGGIKCYHVLGPLFLSDITDKVIESFISKYAISLKQQRRVVKVLGELPVLPTPQFFPYIQMLHCCVTGEKIAYSDMIHDSLPTRTTSTAEEITESYKGRHAGIYAAELELLKMIEDGNPNYKNAHSTLVQRASYTNSTQVGDPLRKSQFVAITFITLCSRAAMRGGLPPATAYAVYNHYEAAIANSTNVTSVAALLNEMFENYVQRVRNSKNNPQVSKAIQSCCDYIDMRIGEDITLKNLAKEVGYTEYYLTRKFKKETGMSVWDYMNQVKIERAKTMLADPTLTIQSISDMLNYCSRSYFSEVFLNCTGMSPSEYRKVQLQM